MPIKNLHLIVPVIILSFFLSLVPTSAAQLSATKEKAHPIHSQDIKVESNHTVTVGQSKDTQVESDQTDTVGSSEDVTVGSDHTETVRPSENVNIGPNHTQLIGASERIHVDSSRTVTVGSSEDKSAKPKGTDKSKTN